MDSFAGELLAEDVHRMFVVFVVHFWGLVFGAGVVVFVLEKRGRGVGRGWEERQLL